MKKLIFTILMLTGLTLTAGLVDKSVVIGGKSVVIGGSTIYRETAWTPKMIQTTAWFDASDLNTITESVGFVSTWNDKSGNNHDLTQATGSKQPFWNGSYMDYDHVQKQYMVNLTNIVSALDLNDLTIFALMRCDDITTAHIELLGNATISGEEGINVRYSTGSPYVIGTLRTDAMVQKPNLSEDEIISFYNNVTRGNGVDHAFQPYTFNRAKLVNGTSTSTAFSVGASKATQSRTFDGRIYEVIICKGLSEDDTRIMEGYLAWKWGMEADLPIGHPYKSARPMIETPDIYFSPSDITTLVWYDASDESTLTIDIDGSSVTGWDDKSPSGFDLEQSTGSLQPEAYVRTLYGKNVLDFDADSMHTITSGAIMPSATNFSIAVIQIDAPGAQQRFTDRKGVGGRWLWGISARGIDVETTNRYAHYNGTVLSEVSPRVTPQLRIWSAEETGTGKNLWVDGAITISGASGTEKLNNGMKIGSNVANAQGLDGFIAEMIFVTGAVSIETRQKLEGYLAWKWGLRGNLASDHPYKNHRPRKIE